MGKPSNNKTYLRRQPNIYSKLKRNRSSKALSKPKLKLKRIYLTFFGKAIRVCGADQIGVALTSIKGAAVRLVEDLAPSTIARG